jgi:ATP-dependent Lon protease
VWLATNNATSSSSSSSVINPIVQTSKKLVQIIEENIKSEDDTATNTHNNTTIGNTNISISPLSEIHTIVSKKIQEESLRQRIISLETSLSNKLVIMKHFHNMKRSDSNSSEYYKNQIFVDLALSYPWNTYFNISNNISKFKNIQVFLQNIKENLDKEIYGMENVKNEILNVVCKFITNPNGTRNNIALYGKAGIAKSKIVKVLSKVLDIPIKSISLGGIKDSSFFLGHGYVYVESGPGKILQNVIDSKISNPILYFDE